MELKYYTEYNSTLHDTKSIVSLDGEKLLLISQSKTKTIQVINVYTNLPIASIDIDGETIHCITNDSMDFIFIYYISSRTLYIEMFYIKTTIRSILLRVPDIIGLYSVSKNYISYKRTNNKNYISRINRHSRIVWEKHVDGMPFDLNELDNDRYIYALHKYNNKGMNVKLVYSTQEKEVHRLITENGRVYLSLTAHPIFPRFYIALGIIEKEHSRIELYKIKTETPYLRLRYTEFHPNTEINYVYINTSFNNLLYLSQSRTYSSIMLYSLNKDTTTKNYSVVSFKTLYEMGKGSWILNHSTDFEHITATLWLFPANTISILLSNQKQDDDFLYS